MNIEEIFGVRVFDDAAMKITPAQKKPMRAFPAPAVWGKLWTPEIADVVACAMKDWAIEQGATHYSPLGSSR